MMQARLLLIGFAAPVVPGWFIVRCILPSMPSRVLVALTAFPVGVSFLTVSLFLLHWLGMPITHINAVGVYMGLTAITYALWRRLREPARIIPETGMLTNAGSSILSGIFIAGIIATLAMHFCASLSEPVVCRPGVAIWDYKACMIALDHAIPFAALTDPDRSYMQPRYPLEYPLFLAWLYGWTGTVDTMAIKLVPPLLASLLALALYTILTTNGLRRDLAGMMTLVVVSGSTYHMCAVTMYAEHLLFLHVLLGMYYLAQALSDEYPQRQCLLGGILLASSAWVKNEGTIYIGAAAFSWMLVRTFSRPPTTWAFQNPGNGTICESLAERRSQTIKGIALILLPLLFMVLPWQILLARLEVTVSDFSLASAAFGSWEIFLNRSRLIWTACMRSVTPIFVLAGTLLAYRAIIEWFRVVDCKKHMFHLVTGISVVLGLSGCFYFSALGIERHLLTMPRIFLGVLFCCLSAYSMAIHHCFVAPRN